MEKYYYVVILNAMTSALDIPSEYNATVAKLKLIECRGKIPTKDTRTKVAIDRYIELINALFIALDKNNDADYDCIRSGMYDAIANFAKHVSDEIESIYF